MGVVSLTGRSSISIASGGEAHNTKRGLVMYNTNKLFFLILSILVNAYLSSSRVYLTQFPYTHAPMRNGSLYSTHHTTASSQTR